MWHMCHLKTCRHSTCHSQHVTHSTCRTQHMSLTACDSQHMPPTARVMICMNTSVQRTLLLSHRSITALYWHALYKPQEQKESCTVFDEKARCLWPISGTIPASQGSGSFPPKPNFPCVVTIGVIRNALAPKFRSHKGRRGKSAFAQQPATVLTYCAFSLNPIPCKVLPHTEMPYGPTCAAAPCCQTRTPRSGPSESCVQRKGAQSTVK